MIFSAHSRELSVRMRIVAGAVACGLMLLVAALFRVQVLQAELYGTREQAQSLRRIRIPSARGDIVDRHGLPLANNRPSHDIVLYLDQLRGSKRQDIYKVIHSNLTVLAETMQMPVTLTERDIRTHYQKRRALPLTVWRDVAPALQARFAEQASHLPATDLIATPLRQYPHGQLAAHLLGYVGQPEQPEDDEDFYYYQPDLVGKQGVEKFCDEALRGSPGARTIRVNPAGQRVAEIAYKPPERGDRVILTIDTRIQRIVEEALDHAPLPAGAELRGAAVVLDPRTGEVLAMASRPTFDPNLFTQGAPAEQLTTILRNPASPLLNRATNARYAPGSTFKPLTLLAALNSAAVQPTDTTICHGSLQIGNRNFGCWNRHGHGRVDAAAAIRCSCDVWFYEKGMATKVEAIAQTARDFGLGQRTGFDAGNELEGLVPTPTWKRTYRGERWWDADTAQMAIGQSFLLTTPLQMACVAAALANGGTLWRPFLVRRITTADGTTVSETKPEIRRQIASTHFEFVRQTMLAAVQAADGTGHRAALKGVSIAGKTGTAEADIRIEGALQRIKRVWFIGFAPFESPQIALTIVLEQGDSGGSTAAPVAGQIFSGIFGKPTLRPARAGTYAD
ncbi:MAG: penicillin-binding protein 2 [Verrucomicrobiae bacterium]|nr:penicillin-binding protein 2 [Verrucomicrobiae bacterium]